MTKSFIERRLDNPDDDIVARIRCVRLGTTGKIDVYVEIDGEGNHLRAAGLLEAAAKVLRQP